MTEHTGTHHYAPCGAWAPVSGVVCLVCGDRCPGCGWVAWTAQRPSGVDQ